MLKVTSPLYILEFTSTVQLLSIHSCIRFIVVMFSCSIPVILQNPADVIPCYGRLPLVDPATGLEYNCGLYGGVECPQNSFCHHTQTFAKCCPKGIHEHECVILEFLLATMLSTRTNLETENAFNNCTGCCTEEVSSTDDQDMLLEHPVAAPNAGPDSPKGCPLHCKCNPLGTI